MSDIIFPERTAKISEIKLFNFKQGGGCGVNIEVDNGDVFSAYNNEKLFSKLKVGSTIRYILLKTQDKTKVKSLKLVTKMKKKPLIPNLDNVDISSILFIDIETVRITDKLGNKGTPLFESWAYKRRKEGETDATSLKRSYENKAALYSEFGKIVTISIGMVKRDGEVFIQSYYEGSEKEVLTQFMTVLNSFTKAYPNLILCGHSIIGFDIPYLVRRLIINNIRVPNFLNTIDEKPWTLGRFIDIANWWKGSGFYGASLTNMAVALGIPSPKQSIDGSQVSNVYYKSKKGLVEVTKYCEQDVFTVINIMQHLFNTNKSTIFTSKTFENE